MADNKVVGDVEEEDIKFKERKRWVFFGLPFTFTKYIITDNMITRNEGFLSKVENDCYMYKVVDVRLVTSFFERIFKLGTVICYTGDTTDKELKLVHVKHAKAIKNYILEASEAARLKRRTINTMSLNSGDIADVDDVDGVD